MMHEDDKELFEQLGQSAQKLNNAQVNTPDIQYFRNIVDAQLANQRKAQKRQFALFIAFAAILVSALLVCFSTYQAVFIIVQISVGAVAVMSLLFSIVKRPGEGYR